MTYIPTIKIHDVKDAAECELAVAWLYETIEEFHGEEKTRRMFAPYGRSLTPSDISKRKNMQLLFHYYSMRNPNKQKLAEQLAGMNKTLPRDKRYGPRGSLSSAAMWKQIDRLLKEKRYRALRAEADALFSDA